MRCASCRACACVYVETLSDMIEEAQRMANAAPTWTLRLQLLAQRDALTEAKLRLRDGLVDPSWTARPVSERLTLQ